jgi:hypothetical protein
MEGCALKTLLSRIRSWLTPAPTDEPSPGISWDALVSIVDEERHLYGIAYLWHASEPGEPVELLVLHTPDVIVLRVVAGLVTGYSVRLMPGRSVALQPGEILEIRPGDDVLAKVRHWARGQAQ